jgi:hypothetical protein
MTEHRARSGPDLATDHETSGDAGIDGGADTGADTDTTTETHHEPHGSASPHGPADDVPGHEPDDAGGHGEHDEHRESLGPLDIRAWAAGAVGVLLGLVVVLCLVVATGAFGR